MVARLIALLALCACTASAVSLKDLIARMSEGGAAVAYVPPGWSTSFSWYKFDGTDTNNIPDYSAVGTNSLYAFLVGTNTAGWTLSGGEFSVRGSYNMALKSRYNAPANVTQATIYAWARVDQIVNYAGHFRVFGTYNYGFSSTRPIAYWRDTSLDQGVNLSTGVWHHLCLVHEGNGASKYYIDGVQKASGNLAATAMDQSRVLIGTTDAGNWTYQWVGSISEYYMTRYLMTSNEVVSVYQKGAQ